MAAKKYLALITAVVIFACVHEGLHALWATIFFMLGDPFNLSIGPFIYGGDIGGLVVGFGINKHLLQGLFFMILLLSRELIAQRLLPVYGQKTNHPFFQPWLKLKKGIREVTIFLFSGAPSFLRTLTEILVVEY
jgi:hypothetical protein